MSLDGVVGLAGAGRRAALQDPARDRGPEPARPHGGAEPTNGDGFGLGWYGAGERPARLSVASRRQGRVRTCASSRRISSRRSSSRRAHTCGEYAIGARRWEQTNCHPFRRGLLAVCAQRLPRGVSPPSAAISCWRCRPPGCSPTFRGRPTPRVRLSPPPRQLTPGSITIQSTRSRADRRHHRGGCAPVTASSDAVQESFW